jgi:hypothetical protein
MRYKKIGMKRNARPAERANFSRAARIGCAKKTAIPEK